MNETQDANRFTMYLKCLAVLLSAQLFSCRLVKIIVVKRASLLSCKQFILKRIDSLLKYNVTSPNNVSLAIV
jgi:hypothetical protein